MSNSDPTSSIYMDDNDAEVNLKIKKAFCPPQVVSKNPCLEYIEYIIFPWLHKFKVKQKPENRGEKIYENFQDVRDDYELGELHPKDLKNALAEALNRILQPIRDHFKNDKKQQLLKEVKEPQKRVKGRKKKSSTKFQSLSISSASEPRLKKKFDLINSIGEECIQKDELERLLVNKPQIICYDGFEPSGRMHIAQGVMKATNVKEMISAGCKVKLWIADWFAKMNNKVGGDMEKIKDIGLYMIEIWKALGMNSQEVEFIWSSQEIKSRNDEYWPRVIDIASRNSIRRITRCGQIMGRSEQDELSAAQIFYPCMQCADIFFLQADICQMGMDQRKVNMLAREYCDDIERNDKPIILSHQMLPGLLEGQEKMSKSDPSSAIFMDDSEDDVNLKINQCFCPPKVVEENACPGDEKKTKKPKVVNACLAYVKYLAFPYFKEFTVETESGGDKTFNNFQELADAYKREEVQPKDVKRALAKALNNMLQPVRDHFNNAPKAKELAERVKSYKVTR